MSAYANFILYDCATLHTTDASCVAAARIAGVVAKRINDSVCRSEQRKELRALQAEFNASFAAGRSRFTLDRC
jgi:hypothetical protein